MDKPLGGFVSHFVVGLTILCDKVQTFYEKTNTIFFYWYFYRVFDTVTLVLYTTKFFFFQVPDP